MQQVTRIYKVFMAGKTCMLYELHNMYMNLNKFPEIAIIVAETLS